MPIRAAAEPLPDDPDNRSEDDMIQVTGVPDAPKVGTRPVVRYDGKGSITPWFQYRDPLMGVLDYIAEVRVHGYPRLLQVYLLVVCSKRNAPRTP